MVMTFNNLFTCLLVYWFTLLTLQRMFVTLFSNIIYYLFVSTTTFCSAIMTFISSIFLLHS